MLIKNIKNTDNNLFSLSEIDEFQSCNTTASIVGKNADRVCVDFLEPLTFIESIKGLKEQIVMSDLQFASSKICETLPSNYHYHIVLYQTVISNNNIGHPLKERAEPATDVTLSYGILKMERAPPPPPKNL